jgi:uncharacterized phage protein (TIGR01671 family)
MSRELKFKLLDIKNNKFWVDGKGWDLYSLFVAYRGQIADTKNYQLIQFTGLLDKNGKEIYEGDIAVYQPNITASKTGEILFEDGAFVFNGIKSAKGFVCLHAFTNNEIGGLKAIKVIGNIFQNPELLKKA